MSSGMAGEQVAGERVAADRVAWVVAEVAGLHEDLGADVAWRLGEADLLRVTGSLVRLRAGVEAAYLRAVAEVDRRRCGGSAGGDGTGGPVLTEGPRGSRSGIGSSTESFLRTSAPLTPSQARADVVAARALGPDGSLRELEPQLACGDITRAHVDVATRCLDRIPGHLRSDEQDRVTIAGYFAQLAPTRHALELKHHAAALLQRLAPEAVDRFDPRSHERRFLDWTSDATGMLLGRFALDPAAGATLRAAVDAASAPSVAGVRDERSARERRADALVMVADTALGVGGAVRGERPRVVVHTTAEQLAGLAARAGSFVGSARTDAGTRLGPDAVRRVACDAVLQRVVWDRDGTVLGSVPLDLGRTARLADVHLRRALAARDRGCIIPGCGAQPAHCDAHHVVHWADGGPTSLGNSVLLCGSHHTAVHDEVWQVRIRTDGIPEVVPPDRVDPLRRPRRAPHHDTDDLLDTMASPTEASPTEAGTGARRPHPGSDAPPDRRRRPGWDPDEPNPF